MQKKICGGERLKRLRMRLGLTTREVDELSRAIASRQGSEDFTVSHARLVQVENEESVPSIFKCFSLSAVYGVSISEILSYYMDVDAPSRLHMTMDLAHTHPSSVESPRKDKTISFPVRLNPGASASLTTPLSELVEAWGEVPVSVLEQLNPRKFRYAFIGLSDYTMYPLIRPGSFVQIDQHQKVPGPAHYHSEYDRPIFLIELRGGYVCSWVELESGRLRSVPHPLSPCRTREFAYPSEAEIVGRVTGAAVRLVQPEKRALAGRDHDGCDTFAAASGAIAARA